MCVNNVSNCIKVILILFLSVYFKIHSKSLDHALKFLTSSIWSSTDQPSTGQTAKAAANMHETRLPILGEQ